MDEELAYQAWHEREVAVGRDPDDQLAAFLEDEPPDPEPACLGSLSDDELVERMLASRRRMNREHHEQVLAVAEFGRRRQRAYEDATARGVPTGVRPGGFPGEELAVEMLVTRAEAGHLIADAADLASRLPRTLAGVAAGLIDEARAGWIAFYTRGLSPEAAAYADQLLAAAAPELRADQLARKAATLEMKLNPEGVKARREQARRNHQRVEARREASGNASLAAREMDTARALASKAHIDTVAAGLRAAGMPGSLDELRVLAFSDLTTGRDPYAQLAFRAGTDPGDTDPGAAADGGKPAPAGSAASAHLDGPAPLPALVNLLVPAGTLLGWSTAPAQAGAWGLLDPGDTGTVVAAAAASSRTRWCVTLVNPDGTALAHGCAAGPAQGCSTTWNPSPRPGSSPPSSPGSTSLSPQSPGDPATTAKWSSATGHRGDCNT